MDMGALEVVGDPGPGRPLPALPGPVYTHPPTSPVTGPRRQQANPTASQKGKWEAWACLLYTSDAADDVSWV